MLGEISKPSLIHLNNINDHFGIEYGANTDRESGDAPQEVQKINKLIGNCLHSLYLYCITLWYIV